MGGRGRRHVRVKRLMIIELVDVAVLEGASEKKACELLGLAATTIDRWRKSATGDDERVGP